MRIPIIAANWKMHKDSQEAVDFVESLGEQLRADSVEAVVCPPHPLLGIIAEPCRTYGLKLGAQNMYWEEAGAFTGEVSPLLLKDIGVHYVIVGHSERRQLFGETDQHVARKANAAFAHDLTPIICVGETQQERQSGQTMSVISEQVTVALTGLDPSQARKAVIAYEPVWAIGSGQAATGTDAAQVAQHIRKVLGEMFSLKLARDVRIQYGGSVKPDNIQEFMREPEIDGALVGGASLDADLFAGIVHNALGAAVS
ncbi:triose-phosphate isomerase [Dethiobacter alkaliphilus]|uniref:triose-phosphate isomerase n=1 Tax=Dethiobacter alkaliphilus TaxID=427926 RepID=UPI002226E91F|nr:triose-phosphate isomerase [Dethiobacter alkaliphilus]MCW3488609.1 triose-phosphate isomerase [Dethiobacter alkaliphilus]